jgi:hypothetical protein
LEVALVTESEVKETRDFLSRWGREYREEIPSRIHASGHGQHYGLGSAPPFAPEFIRYIGRLNCKRPNCKECREDLPIYLEGEEYRKKHSDERTRITRAFRKLRRAAPLEFDVLYMAVMLGHSVAEIAQKLTERAAARGHADTYDETAVTVLAIVGVEKVSAWM